jgi:hypothetical protein
MKLDTLIFLHVPKTAGSTFSSVLIRQYPSQLRFYGPYDKIVESMDKLSSMPEEMRRRLKLVYIVHAGFGIHHCLTQRSSYVSFLRDPWKRTFSDYLHASRNRDHSFYLQAQQGKSFDDFLQHRVRMQGLTNPMTRLISGINPYQPFRPLSQDALVVACTNIDKYFGVVGLQERYDESLMLMKQYYGWGNIFYQRRNVGQNTKQNEIYCSPEMREIFQEENSYDFQLYEFARNKLEKSIQNQGTGFKEKVKKFQSYNSQLEAILNSLRTLKQRLVM